MNGEFKKRKSKWRRRYQNRFSGEFMDDKIIALLTLLLRICDFSWLLKLRRWKKFDSKFYYRISLTPHYISKLWHDLVKDELRYGICKTRMFWFKPASTFNCILCKCENEIRRKIIVKFNGQRPLIISAVTLFNKVSKIDSKHQQSHLRRNLDRIVIPQLEVEEKRS